MRCGHCKQEGHDRRTCESLKASENYCIKTKRNDRGTLIRSVGWNPECKCWHCKIYRDLNLPTPEIAVVRQAEKHKKDQYPQLSVENKTNTPIYIYRNLSPSGWSPVLLWSGVENDIFKINLDSGYESTWGPFIKDDETQIDQFIVTDTNFGDSADLSVFTPKKILKFITLDYGKHQEIVIEEEPKDDEARWRSAALKSRYLLEQMERMGAKNNPNLEPIMDLLQDIEFPGCSEVDKERAGIPSELTNIT